jgi:predicted translin family RNA/ssDNA-binding protein
MIKFCLRLDRVSDLQQAIPPEIAAETQERLSAIWKLFDLISPDLQGINTWRYQRQASPGIQEFMEATLFEHYLRTQSLISCEEAAKALPPGIGLITDDYILGLFDLVGELMRFAITAMATNGWPSRSKQVKTTDERTLLIDLQQLRTHFEGLTTTSCGGIGLGRDVERKIEVMKSCVEKVEAAVYGMAIRGKERPKGWVPVLPDHGAGVENH